MMHKHLPREKEAGGERKGQEKLTNKTERDKTKFLGWREFQLNFLHGERSLWYLEKFSSIQEILDSFVVSLFRTPMKFVSCIEII